MIALVIASYSAVHCQACIQHATHVCNFTKWSDERAKTTAAKECAVSKSGVYRVFPQFQPTNAQNWRLIQNDIFENIKHLPISELTGPSLGSILFVVNVL